MSTALEDLEDPGLTYTVAPTSAVRRTMAARMRQSSSEIPQVTLQAEADADALAAAVSAAGADATVTAYLLQLVALALVRRPELNSWVVGKERRLFDRVNLGVAVASKHGLMVPVVHDAHTLTVPELGERLLRLRSAADERKLRTEDVTGGTFTVTNLGTYGVGHFSPLVNPPQVGILGVGALTTRPVVRDGALAERRHLPLSLTFDHAAIDGAEAALFLRDLTRSIADPAGTAA